MSCLRLFIVLLTLLSSGFASGFVHASLSFGDAPRASDEELDHMRGGFIVSFNGQDFLMPFSITGIERLTQIGSQTYLNGELVSPRVNPQALFPVPASQAGVNLQAPVAVSVASSASGGTMSGESASPANGSSSPNTSSTNPGNGPIGASMAADAGAGAATGGATDAVTAVSTPAQVTTNGPLIVIQSGAANTVMLPANVSLDSLATFIQNSVNDQVIRNITTMNITIQSQMLTAQARLSAILNQGLNGLR